MEEERRVGKGSTKNEEEASNYASKKKEKGREEERRECKEKQASKQARRKGIEEARRSIRLEYFLSSSQALDHQFFKEPPFPTLR